MISPVRTEGTGSSQWGNQPDPSSLTTAAFTQEQSGTPPAWLVVTTGALALTCLVLAIAETNLWAHYLIDRGEFLGLFGLGFILVAGLHLFRRRRLFASLPLVLPWLIYPVITQGDQIIDNLSINAMRVICQVLLAVIFAMPVATVVLAARWLVAPQPGQPPRAASWMVCLPGLRALAEGRTREGVGLLAAALFVAEIWVAHEFLGVLMVLTLMVLILSALVLASNENPPDPSRLGTSRGSQERFALGVLLVGVTVSLGLYLGYKHRPGAYHGSPSAFMDPSQTENVYPLDRIPVPARVPTAPAAPELVREALTGYGHILEALLAGYHILDRNYTYDFHNHLFLKHTPLVPDYRTVGLHKIEAARQLRAAADAQATAARSTLADDDPLAALLDDVRGYVAFSFDRSPTLERMSGQFERTEAGLQHAAHLYEGESKALGQRLANLLEKHERVLESPATQPVISDFASSARSVYAAYAKHVVGF